MVRNAAERRRIRLFIQSAIYTMPSSFPPSPAVQDRDWDRDWDRAGSQHTPCGRLSKAVEIGPSTQPATPTNDPAWGPPSSESAHCPCPARHCQSDQARRSAPPHKAPTRPPLLPSSLQPPPLHERVGANLHCSCHWSALGPKPAKGEGGGGG